MVTLYFFAIFATQQIGQEDEIYNEYFEKTHGYFDHEVYFGTVPRSMLTLFQICTLDKWSENIVRHVKHQQPGMEWLFVSFVTFSTFGLLNLVIGVIVENTLASAKVNETKMKKKREKDRMRVLNHLREFFEQSDEDGSGTLTVEEVQQAMKDPEAMNKLKLIDLPLEDPNEIFALLDVDQSGELSIDEFISGCMRIKGNARSKDLLAVQIAVDTLGSKFSDLNHALETAGDKIMKLDERTAEMMMKCEKVFLPEREARRRNNEMHYDYDDL
jgi:voltage-gated sodium channel